MKLRLKDNDFVLDIANWLIMILKYDCWAITYFVMETLILEIYCLPYRLLLECISSLEVFKYGTEKKRNSRRAYMNLISIIKSNGLRKGNVYTWWITAPSWLKEENEILPKNWIEAKMNMLLSFHRLSQLINRIINQSWNSSIHDP